MRAVTKPSKQVSFKIAEAGQVVLPTVAFEKDLNRFNFYNAGVARVGTAGMRSGMEKSK
jgi:hypothetical protein